MLAGTEWGASPNTLRVSTLSLMYGTINYSSPIWINSAHTNKIDTQINGALRIISGTLKGWCLEWLYYAILLHLNCFGENVMRI